jgi:hypothetical protein
MLQRRLDDLEHPEHGIGGRRDRVRIARIEDRLDGVQRARADVPEDNAESADRESPLGGSAPVHDPSIRLPARPAPAYHPNERS